MSDKWGSLADDARTLTGGGGVRCHIARLLDTLGPSARKAVRDALADRDLSAAALEKVLTDRVGQERAPSAWTIGNHRRGACRCDR